MHGFSRLVRIQATKAYLCDDGTWSQDYSLAVHFEDTQSVLNAIRGLDKAELEMVLMMGQKPSNLDVVLALFSD